MKYYNKILEAVNKGIQLALDDFEDIENNSISDDIINTKDVIADRAEIDKLTVDLGLPSGTRWCKYNLGVNSKVYLNTAKKYYGNYYAWGEISSRKRKYSWDNYKYAIAYNNIITKYTTTYDYLIDLDVPDNLTILQPEDDIATLTYGNHYHIPSWEDFKELHENTTVFYEENHLGIPGLSGITRVSKINGNFIFFPLPGYKTGEKGEDRLREVGKIGRYWTCELNPYDNTNAYIYSIAKNGIITAGPRRYGYSIRPVYSPIIK